MTFSTRTAEPQLPPTRPPARRRLASHNLNRPCAKKAHARVNKKASAKRRGFFRSIARNTNDLRECSQTVAPGNLAARDIFNSRCSPLTGSVLGQSLFISGRDYLSRARRDIFSRVITRKVFETFRVMRGVGSK